VTTQKAGKVYVHVLHWNAPLLALPPIQANIASAHTLLNGAAVEFTQNNNGLVLTLPAAAKDEVDRVIVLSFANTK
jgi:alpha-L-fucosidase